MSEKLKLWAEQALLWAQEHYNYVASRGHSVDIRTAEEELRRCAKQLDEINTKSKKENSK